MISFILVALMACEPELPPGQCENADLIESYVDADGDGFGDPGTRELVCQLRDGIVSNKADCDDQRSLVHPDALEICDGIDNNCDDEVDERLRQFDYFQDLDGDGYGNFDETSEACTPPPGYVENSDDCDDLNGLISPAAREICNGGTDDNCNGRSDDLDQTLDRETATLWYYDLDDDGYGGLEPLPFPAEAIERFAMTNPVQACRRPEKPLQLQGFPGNWVGNVDDCDDTNPMVSPAGIEICNFIDDDCDQRIDDSDSDLDPSSQSTFWADDDRDGAGDASKPVLACFQPWFTADNDIDCDDTEPLLAAPTGWWLDDDGDGFGTGALSAAACVGPTADHVLPAFGEDCDDLLADINPDALEICDGADNDCDELVDVEDPDLNTFTAVTVYRDVDGDGFGDFGQAAFACEGFLLPGFADNGDDCDDRRDFVAPDAIETCNAFDDDCDGLIDTADPDVDLSTAPVWYADFDEDGWGNAALPVTACAQPPLYVGNSIDCDDGDEDAGPEVKWWLDGDGDGFGTGAKVGPQCDQPSPTAVPVIGDEDCDDFASNVYPGAYDLCFDGIDVDCNGVDGGAGGCVPDTCGEAQALPLLPVAPVTLMVDVSTFGVDLPLLSCIPGASPTADAFLPVEVGAGKVIRAGVTSIDDAYVAIVTSCSDGTSCLLGSEQIASGAEHAEYENSGGAGLAYIVVGCRTTGGCNDVVLDFTVEDATVWLADTCAQMTQTPYTTGAYILDGTLTPAVDNLNLPGATSCTNYSTQGRDVFLPVTLQAGEEIRVSYDTNADSAVYLLTTCGDGGSCVDGEDAGDPEEIKFTNNTGAVKNYTLGLDCYGTTCDAFTATILIR